MVKRLGRLPGKTQQGNTNWKLFNDRPCITVSERKKNKHELWLNIVDLSRNVEFHCSRGFPAVNSTQCICWNWLERMVVIVVVAEIWIPQHWLYTVNSVPVKPNCFYLPNFFPITFDSWWQICKEWFQDSVGTSLSELVPWCLSFKVFYFVIVKNKNCD